MNLIMTGYGVLRIGNTCYINAAIQSILWSSGLGRILNVLKLCDKTECLLCSLTALKRNIPISPLERLAPFLGELVEGFDQQKLFDADEFVRGVVGRLLKYAEGHSEKVLISQNFYNW